MIERLPERLSERHIDELCRAYRVAQKRLVLSDYDGTLVPFAARPRLAAPDPPLLALLARLVQDEQTHAFMISGRDKATLEDWFGGTGIGLIAEHGAWTRRGPSPWRLNLPLDAKWKDRFRSLLAEHVDRNPLSFAEEKDFSLVWHYRLCDYETGDLGARTLIEMMRQLADGRDLEVLEGNKVVELRPRGMNKGVAAAAVVASLEPEFILAIGDDRTDEDLFHALPSRAVSVRVGPSMSRARYHVADYRDARRLLTRLGSSPSPR